MEAVNEIIADQSKFKEEDHLDQGVNFIIDSIVFAKEAIDSILPELFYLIHWKSEIHVKFTKEQIKSIVYLSWLLKKYHTENADKPTAISPPIDKDAPLFFMAMQYGIKVASPITSRKGAPIKSPQSILSYTSKLINSLEQVYCCRWRQKSRFRFSSKCVILLRSMYFAKACTLLFCFSLFESFQV